MGGCGCAGRQRPGILSAAPARPGHLPRHLPAPASAPANWQNGISSTETRLHVQPVHVQNKSLPSGGRRGRAKDAAGASRGPAGPGRCDAHSAAQNSRSSWQTVAALCAGPWRRRQGGWRRPCAHGACHVTGSSYRAGGSQAPLCGVPSYGSPRCAAPGWSGS